MSPAAGPIATAPNIPPRADAVVLGGGMADIAAAFELARRGAVLTVSVVVGEQSNRISASLASCEGIDAGN